MGALTGKCELSVQEHSDLLGIAADIERNPEACVFFKTSEHYVSEDNFLRGEKSKDIRS